MRIVVTAGEVNDCGDWDVFCDLTGTGEWAMNEGQLDSSEEFKFTVEEICKLGMRHWLKRKITEGGIELN